MEITTKGKNRNRKENEISRKISTTKLINLSKSSCLGTSASVKNRESARDFGRAFLFACHIFLKCSRYILLHNIKETICTRDSNGAILQTMHFCLFCIALHDILHVALRSVVAHIWELRFLYSFVRDRADFRGVTIAVLILVRE